MKKLIMITISMIISTPALSGEMLDSIAKDAGSALGTFANSAATSALPSGSVTIADAYVNEDLIQKSEDSSNSRQSANLVEVYNSNIDFVYANTYVEGDSLFLMDNCDDSCAQSVNQILIESDGAGFTGVWAQAAINGTHLAKMSNSHNSTQAINHIIIGHK